MSLTLTFVLLVNPTPEEAITLLEATIGRLRSYDIRYTVTERFLIIEDLANGQVTKRLPRVGEIPVVRSQSFRHRRSGDDERLDFLAPDRTDEKSWYLGLQRDIVLDYPTRIAYVRGWSPQFCLEGGYYPETFSSFYQRILLAKVLWERNNLQVSQVGGDLVLRADPLDRTERANLPTWGVHVILDGNHGYWPRRIERFNTLQGKPFTRRTLQVERWHRVDGFNVPTKSVTVPYDPDPNSPTFGAKLKETTLDVDVARSEWNRPVEETVFIPKIPKGFTVVDEIKGITYVAEGTDTPERLDHLAQTTKRYMELPPPWPTERKSNALYYYLGGGAVVLFALCALAYRRFAAR